MLKALRKTLPVRLSSIKRLVSRNEQVDCGGYLFLKVYCLAYVSSVVTLVGNFMGLFKIAR